MKFIVDNLSKSSGRLGFLIQNGTEKHFQTPFLLQATKSGSIPNLSREVFEYVSDDVPILEMSLDQMEIMADSIQNFPSGVATYVGYKGSPFMLTTHNTLDLTRSGFTTKNFIPLMTRHGKKKVDINQYMKLVEIMKPDMYQGISDADTNIDSSTKRINNSVEHTESYMNFCYLNRPENSSLFVPIVGGFSMIARNKSIKHSVENGGENIGGYLFEGFHNNGLSATEVDGHKCVEIVADCCTQLDKTKPIMMLGAYTPLLMLELICLGVDIFDTSYAYCATDNFKILVFNFNVKEEKAMKSPFLDITDESFKEDFTPFLEDCACLACRKHTRAYVHHLYKTHELLGPILIMIHNLHHLMQFFEVIRATIKQDTLNTLIKLIKYQSTEKEINYRIAKNTKELSNKNAPAGVSVAPTIDAVASTEDKAK